MELIETIDAFRQARARFERLGLVPTMGYLHEGHLSSGAAGQAECGAVAVSIFVNLTQFGPNEDLARYPRNLERDLRAAGPGADRPGLRAKRRRDPPAGP